MSTFAFKAYDLIWRLARPVLNMNQRLTHGMGQRTLQESMPVEADIWIQAASGGECYLTREIVNTLPSITGSRSIKVLATTNTKQGMEILEKTAQDLSASKKNVSMQLRYFPFDAPSLMRSAIKSTRPKVAVVLETEIWPGFLRACKEESIPVLLANGRMNPRSLAGYLTAKKTFRELAPEAIFAVSEQDARRFGTLFGHDRVRTMPNIKFDRMISAGTTPRSRNPLSALIAPKTDFVVLGSVRKEEESDVLGMTALLHRSAPKAVVGLFPRHMERLEFWQEALDGQGLPWTLRSALRKTAEPGTIILWDTFGELIPAYGLAKAAFVGGSLAPLGGQNFLEPMTCGVVPVTGPSWHNFSWVGAEIFESGMAIRANDSEEVLNHLLSLLKKAPQRKSVAARAKSYIGDRKGGTKTVCKHIAHFINNV